LCTLTVLYFKYNVGYSKAYSKRPASKATYKSCGVLAIAPRQGGRLVLGLHFALSLTPCSMNKASSQMINIGWTPLNKMIIVFDKQPDS